MRQFERRAGLVMVLAGMLAIWRCADSNEIFTQQELEKIIGRSGGDAKLIIADSRDEKFYLLVKDAVEDYKKLHGKKNLFVFTTKAIQDKLPGAKIASPQERDVLFVHNGVIVHRAHYPLAVKNKVMINISRHLYPEFDLIGYFRDLQPHLFVNQSSLEQIENNYKGQTIFVLNNMYHKCKIGERGLFTLDVVSDNEIPVVISNLAADAYELDYLSSIFDIKAEYVSDLYEDSEFGMRTYHALPNMVIHFGETLESHLVSCEYVELSFNLKFQEVH